MPFWVLIRQLIELSSWLGVVKVYHQAVKFNSPPIGIWLLWCHNLIIFFCRQAKLSATERVIEDIDQSDGLQNYYTINKPDQKANSSNIISRILEKISKKWTGTCMAYIPFLQLAVVFAHVAVSISCEHHISDCRATGFKGLVWITIVGETPSSSSYCIMWHWICGTIGINNIIVLSKLMLQCINH